MQPTLLAADADEYSVNKVSSIILDFSSVHENPPQLEAAVALSCNINKVLS